MSLRAQASFALSCALGGALAGACTHQDTTRPGQTTTTGFALPGQVGAPPGTDVDEFTPSSAELTEADHPANRLAVAACQRKQECDEIGDGKPHESLQACLTSSRRHAHEELDRLSCEKGLDPKSLYACEKAIRIAECARVDNIGSNEACTSRRLCMR
jgi:hypothetical protein